MTEKQIGLLKDAASRPLLSEECFEKSSPAEIIRLDTDKLKGDFDADKWMDEVKRTGMMFHPVPEISVEALNNQIQELPSEQKGQISDGYHTFDELYDHRITNYITTCRLLDRLDEVRNPSRQFSPIWKSQYHSDHTKWEGWFILGIFTEPGKQITYHLPMSCWEECAFAITRMRAPQWDGHTSADVLERLKNLPV